MDKEFLKSVQGKIYYDNLKNEAKKVKREDLEELYVRSRDEYENKVSPVWKLIGIVAIIVLLSAILIIYTNESQYDNTEYENYRGLSKYVCEQGEHGDLKYFKTREGDFFIECYNEDILIRID